MATAMISVIGMTCGGCVNAVTKALKSVDGVLDVQVELEAGQATVQFDESKTDISMLKEVIEEAGYDTN
ncbi:heavy-metal-associated domain-containing protein [Alicyclobacillus tolerans]|uniref:Copper chaperone CopZ n=2 Tax=Alicyclobacillus tolerans TaxID=90970 RepID=A0A1M6QQC0_9BACL|nr:MULTISPECIES: cation transporter [Alicyclobacillus]MDP9729435.1 copper ion binding protein [Alicyclobacillus tengchongensis]QRF22802.1 heavy-metal-associated domain-containing protein [Alicyclobacillus sp. TC]SHK22482.1 copper chaperone [Alicyclobacillus montanus]